MRNFDCSQWGLLGVGVGNPSRMSFFFFFNRRVNFYFLAVVGLRRYAWVFSSCGERGLLSAAAHWLLTVSTGASVGFSSCPQPWLPRSMWDLPVSTALAGRFLTTAPPGKPPSGKSWPVGGWCFVME